jgi:translation elongation factor EF-1alpha
MADLANREEVKKLVREVVKEDLYKIVAEEVVKKEKEYEKISLIERIVKVEQSLDNVNKRLEDFMRYVEKRFEQVDKRFEDLNRRIGFMSWFIPTIIIIAVAILKYV